MNESVLRGALLPELREKRPMIHCITNPISINACANAILAVGALPMMAEHPAEVAEIVRTAGALLLNLGNITDVRMESMRTAAQTAWKEKIPFILDAVGVGCSAMRRQYAETIIKDYAPAVVKGNYSEIHALCRAEYHSRGVDTELSLTVRDTARAAVRYAQEHHTVVLASGKTDIVTDGGQLYLISNGTPMLAQVTGTGCMLGALCASYLAVGDACDAAVTACGMLGICGEISERNCGRRGTGSFAVGLMDALSTVDSQFFSENIKQEESSIENL